MKTKIRMIQLLSAIIVLTGWLAMSSAPASAFGEGGGACGCCAEQCPLEIYDLCERLNCPVENPTCAAEEPEVECEGPGEPFLCAGGDGGVVILPSCAELN